MIRYHLGTIKNKEVKIFELEELKNIKTENILQIIDEITMRYINEAGLIKYLEENGLYEKGKDRKIYVVYKNKKVKKLPVLYSDLKKYMDLDYLRYVIQTFPKDIVFLEKLANHFDTGKSTYNLQLANVQALRSYVNDVRLSETKEVFFDQKVYNALNDIFIKAVLKIDKKTGETTINYRGLRDLSTFVKKYMDSLIEKEYEVDDEKIDISRFEYNDSYDEPDFAPNSEEEDMYLDYLESLPTEESDYLYERGKSI